MTKSERRPVISPASTAALIPQEHCTFLFSRGRRQIPWKITVNFIWFNTMPQTPTLYERLGGVYPIATVIDDLIDRIMVDPRLNANPRVDEAHHRVPPAGFKYLATELVCSVTGGPQKYTGKSMADSHRYLKITGEEWQAFLDDLQQT